MEATLPGMATETRLAQPENTCPAMAVTLPGTAMEDRLGQAAKAYSPMEVTLSGMSTPVRHVHPQNAP